MELVHPSQGAVSMMDVREKQNRLKGHAKELKEFLKEKKNRLKVVIGPNNSYYLIDRHHLAYALLLEGIDIGYAEVVDNLSNLSIRDFWKEMKRRNWARFKDENGNGIKKIPPKITLLKDDPYRSLAWVVRNSGAFEKSDIPFSEFYWADYYRKKIERSKLFADWKGSVELAIQLALHNDAKMNPGFHGVSQSSVKGKMEECVRAFQKMNISKGP